MFSACKEQTSPSSKVLLLALWTKFTKAFKISCKSSTWVGSSLRRQHKRCHYISLGSYSKDAGPGCCVKAPQAQQTLLSQRHHPSLKAAFQHLRSKTVIIKATFQMYWLDSHAFGTICTWLQTSGWFNPCLKKTPVRCFRALAPHFKLLTVMSESQYLKILTKVQRKLWKVSIWEFHSPTATREHPAYTTEPPERAQRKQWSLANSCPCKSLPMYLDVSWVAFISKTHPQLLLGKAAGFYKWAGNPKRVDPASGACWPFASHICTGWKIAFDSRPSKTELPPVFEFTVYCWVYETCTCLRACVQVWSPLSAYHSVLGQHSSSCGTVLLTQHMSSPGLAATVLSVFLPAYPSWSPRSRQGHPAVHIGTGSSQQTCDRGAVRRWICVSSCKSPDSDGQTEKWLGDIRGTSSQPPQEPSSLKLVGSQSQPEPPENSSVGPHGIRLEWFRGAWLVLK